MLIGVVSDIHRQTWIVERVMEVLGNIDVLIHLGDNIQDVKEIKKFFKGKILNVKGNCDYSNSIPSDIIENIDGHRFLITHGHNYDVKYSLTRLKEKALKEKADIVLYGHTHISKIIYEEGIWFINPGSPVLARDGKNSVALIEIKNYSINPSIKSIR
ncbi:metallophosphoesterase family protein [Clostridium cochlearium]|uniref:metallophosphoesterase family protein n=1 Tax=Clostridium cochlearium TaxID=1494 RepID=UPI001EDF4004|nr:metallophosphoesterase [Clostridium cochlearium]